jgi:hypothetical protein
MPNGSGGTHDWKNWLIGIMVPLNIGLVGYIWTGNQSNTIRIEGDFRGMIRDVAEIKTEVRELSRRMEIIEGGPRRMNYPAPSPDREGPMATWQGVSILK